LSGPQSPIIEAQQDLLTCSRCTSCPRWWLRLGPDPRVVVTTTPKPIKIIRELIADPTTVITRGSTYDTAPIWLRPFWRRS
jgi:phage terminase large subunit-like protein